jgi:GH15 family glucan-1,4-alpha-glucosidase
MAVQNWRPISDYGLIGNCRTAALVSTEGSIDWLCLPRFDADSVFCSLLDTEIGGFFSVTPSDSFRSRHAYIPDTNVLVTHFQNSYGSAELTDTFTVTDEKTKRTELWPDHEILRKLRCLRGKMKFRMVFYPTHTHGLHGIELSEKPKWGVIGRSRKKMLALQTSLPPNSIRIERNVDGRTAAVADFEISEGQDFWFSLIFEDNEPAVWPALGAPAEERLLKTIRYWTAWTSRCQYEGPYEKEVRRSALALKLLVFAPSGAIVAAPTTSLPEWIGGSRNWDYRYCWLRDASFTVRVFTALGYLEEAKAYVSWLLHSTRLSRVPWRPRLQVLYDIYGETQLKERTIPWLRGYRGSRPVRVGNGATTQFQLDVYGEVIGGISIIAPYLGKIDNETRDMILETARAVVDLWQTPDEGIWEPRAGRAHNTYSKALAWLAMERVAKIAENQKWKTKYDYRGIAEKIRNLIEEKGFNTELGAYTRTLDGNDLDASLLTLPFFGYCDARSPRMQGTINAVMKKLSRNGLLYRYDAGTDGIEEREGAFGICNFWMAEVLFRSGREEEARTWFENLLNKSGHEIGLWSEEIDPATKEYLGNYPQGFSHLGLISAAISANKQSVSRAA